MLLQLRRECAPISKTAQTGKSRGAVIPVATLAQASLAAGDSVVMAPMRDGILNANEASASGRTVTAMLKGMDRYAETDRTLASERLGT